MKLTKITILITISIITLYSCKKQNNPKPIDDYTWKLGWRMVENNWNENYELAATQFDSLLESNQSM